MILLGVAHPTLLIQHLLPVLIGVRRALSRSHAAPRGWVVFAAAVEVEEVVPVIHHTWRTGSQINDTNFDVSYRVEEKCVAALMMRVLLLNSQIHTAAMLANDAGEDDDTVVVFE